MDCIEAQSVISETIDGSLVDADRLDAAKSHCRECPQCGQYIRVLSAVRRAVPPRPPADLADRIMATIRAEAEATEGPESVQDAAVDAEADSESETPITVAPAAALPLAPDANPAQPARPLVSVGGRPMNRRQLMAWGSAAAVLLVLVGVSAALRIMGLVNGAPTRSASIEVAQTAAPEAAPPDVTAGSRAGGASADLATDLAYGSVSAGAVKSAGAANAYVVFGGNTYVHQGVSPQPKSELHTAGETIMSFGADALAKTRPVFTGSAAEAIYIENDTPELQRFVLVKRMYKDTVYRLRSGDIAEYGAWPTIPPGIPRPAPENNPDGSPAFVRDGNDSEGTPVYRRAGADSQTGIAITPGTPANDPAAGNPNWTWWTP